MLPKPMAGLERHLASLGGGGGHWKPPSTANPTQAAAGERARRFTLVCYQHLHNPAWQSLFADLHLPQLLAQPNAPKARFPTPQ